MTSLQDFEEIPAADIPATVHRDLPTPRVMLVDPRFGQLAGQFFRLFERPSSGGGALAVYLGGEPVVDIWSGWSTRDTRWLPDTVSVSFSTTARPELSEGRRRDADRPVCVGATSRAR